MSLFRPRELGYLTWATCVPGLSFMGQQDTGAQHEQCFGICLHYLLSLLGGTPQELLYPTQARLRAHKADLRKLTLRVIEKYSSAEPCI